MHRRRFIQAVTAGLVALTTPQVVDKGLEMITKASAEEPEKSPISEAEFERLMKYDTVDDILKEYGIGSVDDSTYKRKVYGSDKHVMVLFYNNRSHGSKGLAVLTSLLSQEFGSKFEVFGYKMSESDDKTPEDIFKHVTKRYDFEHTPLVVIYKNSGSITKKEETLEKGIITFEGLLKAVKISQNYLRNNF